MNLRSSIKFHLRSLAIVGIALSAASALFTGSPHALAAEPAASTTQTPAGDGINAVIDYAKQQGVRVIIVTPEEAKPVAGQAPAGGLETASILLRNFEREFTKVLSQLGEAPGRIASAIDEADPQGPKALGVICLMLAVLMVLAYLAERLYLRWLKGKVKQSWPTAPTEMPDKMALVITRFLGRCGGVVLFSVIATVFTALALETNEFNTLTVVAAVGAVAAARLFIEFWRVWLSPYMPEYRLAALDDADALAVFRWLAVSAVLSVTLGTIYTWLSQFDVQSETLALLVLIVSTTILVFHLVFIAINKERVSAVISGANAHNRVLPALNRMLSTNWHLLLGGYFIAAWVTSVFRIVLGHDDAVGLSAGMFLILMGCLALYGVGVIAIHAVFSRHRAVEQPPEPEDLAPDLALEAADASPDPQDETETASEVPSVPNTYEALARRALILVVLGCAIGGTFYLWGANPFDDQSPIVRLWDVIFVAIVGYIVFQTTKIAIGQKIAEQEELERAQLEEKGALSGLSRLATLLPLFRNFVLVAIAVIAVMIGLSELGVDIAPLFAGAGIIGLAVGFGAQTLVKDIISGAFFLADDAFRKGEYIDIGDAQGTVEQINIRSMQIRHYDGLLQTVPFGEIKLVTNWSRDWAMMKLKLRVTYDTDVEKVRRLIKKLGKELMEDPDIGHMFLQPVKSQGVHSMDDSAMVIRVKFMTKPGDQYEVRKTVYARIRDLFEREGIKFAHRQVTVHLADDVKDRELDENTKKKVAGAVLPTLEEDQKPQTQPVSDM